MDPRIIYTLGQIRHHEIQAEIARDWNAQPLRFSPLAWLPGLLSAAFRRPQPARASTKHDSGTFARYAENTEAGC
ncbi:MAG: hypothetical protein HXY40_07990 [Chloroflexi bacterium]|nr:hypothetical protein [Chloroflexota bacterium]